MSLDLVLWVKDGAETLFTVLNQIGKVVPYKQVGNRFIVDDGSLNGSKRIAEACDWQVIENEGSGISDAANTALKHVKSKFFISFEQDLFLAENWWSQVPRLLKDDVAVASGIRLSNTPESLKKLQEYVTAKYQGSGNLLYAKTLDNTIYKTGVLKKIGGFPKLAVNAGVDNVLAKRLRDAGYTWQVNYSVQSLHLRKGLYDELKHYFWYGSCYTELKKQLNGEIDSYPNILARALLSPIRGLQVACAKRCWQISYVYPLIRLSVLAGMLKQ